VRREEGRVVPRRLDLVKDKEALLTHPDDDEGHHDGQAELALVAVNAPSVHPAEEEIAHADEGRKEADNVALAGVLTALASHEVLADEDTAELVAHEAEPRHVVESGVNEAARADDEDGDGDAEPDPLVHEERVNLLDEDGEEEEDDGRHEILYRDRVEGKLDLDVRVQMVVDEVNLLLSIVDIVGADVPLLLVGKEFLDRGVAFKVHRADRQVRHGGDAVRLEDILDVTVGTGEVHNAEEDVFWLRMIIVIATILHK